MDAKLKTSTEKMSSRAAFGEAGWASCRHISSGSPFNVVAGDFFTDSLPEGYDAVIIANIVHCFAVDRVVQLLRRVREHAPAGARILLVDFWTDPTHTQPVFAALMAGEFLLTHGGRARKSDRCRKSRANRPEAILRNRR